MSAPAFLRLAPETSVVADSAPPHHGGRKLAFNAMAGGVANLLKIGVQLVMLPLMAHLLGPSEFGLYALALPAVSFCMILADGGLAASLAREPLESALVWSTSFWLVLGVGLALAVVVTGWGYALAALSHQPRVSNLMAMMSLSLLMISVTALPSARLTREARLSVVAAADAASTVLGAGVAVALALAGYGAMSLAAQYVAVFALRAIILNGRGFVRPRMQFKLSAVSGHLSMGSALLGVKLSDFFGRMAENLFYGRNFGAEGLGVYTFANQAPRFITEAASGPVWAALYAFALRERGESLARVHIHLVRLLSALVFPAAALLCATAPDVLRLLLGPKWSQAGELLRLLVPFYALNVVSGQTGAVLFAEGRAWVSFWWSSVMTGGRVVAVMFGPLIGPTGVALGVDLSLAVFAAAMFASTNYRHGARRLMGASAPAIAAATLAGGAAFALLPGANANFASLFLSWLVGGLVYAAALGALERGRVRAALAAAGPTIENFKQSWAARRAT